MVTFVQSKSMYAREPGNDARGKEAILISARVCMHSVGLSSLSYDLRDVRLKRCDQQCNEKNTKAAHMPLGSLGGVVRVVHFPSRMVRHERMTS